MKDPKLPRFEYYENVDRVAAILEYHTGEYDEELAEEILKGLGISKGKKKIFEPFEQNIKAVRVDDGGNITIELTGRVKEQS